MTTALWIMRLWFITPSGFQECMSGPYQMHPGGGVFNCYEMDRDKDGDVDLLDWSETEQSFLDRLWRHGWDKSIDPHPEWRPTPWDDGKPCCRKSH